MKPDSFEQKLQRQPLRQLPEQWRGEILRAAQAARATAEPADIRQSATASVPAWCREWFWPSPVAWGALATVWVLIAFLKLSAPASSFVAAAQTVSSSRTSAIPVLSERQRELALLLDSLAPPRSPKPELPRPRSQRRGEYFHV